MRPWPKSYAGSDEVEDEEPPADRGDEGWGLRAVEGRQVWRIHRGILDVRLYHQLWLAIPMDERPLR